MVQYGLKIAVLIACNDCINYYLYRGIPPCADLKKNTMDTSLNGDEIGQWRDASLPSTAITSTICAVVASVEWEMKIKILKYSHR